jgi:hypothetical protein
MAVPPRFVRCGDAGTVEEQSRIRCRFEAARCVEWPLFAARLSQGVEQLSALSLVSNLDIMHSDVYVPVGWRAVVLYHVERSDQPAVRELRCPGKRSERNAEAGLCKSG